MNGALTLYDLPFQVDYSRVHHWLQSSPYNAVTQATTALHVELFPLHSPLLGESLLVSFPLLMNMLKPSRSSYLTSDQFIELTSPESSVIPLAINLSPTQAQTPTHTECLK